MLMCQCANWLHYHAERHIGILFNWHIGTLLIVTLFIYEEDTVFVLRACGQRFTDGTITRKECRQPEKIQSNLPAAYL